jgi:hypothetical protein
MVTGVPLHRCSSCGELTDHVWCYGSGGKSGSLPWRAPVGTIPVLVEIARERAGRPDAALEDRCDPDEWLRQIVDEVCAASEAVGWAGSLSDPAAYRQRLLAIALRAVAAIEAVDRRLPLPADGESAP